ncbi:MAG TPA: helix-turn-helix domain-containing protein [Pyrinomonadaceae bacterium]|jgi:DNA anti-recombination protein RmuC|nr:helix-turn-helix domain-containing protein [Pyrinomonadaceae bacterium]
MGLFDDILKGLPENAVLRSKVSEAKEENASLKQENASLKDDLRQAKAEIVHLKEQIQTLTHKEDSLHENAVRILSVVAEESHGVYAADLAQQLGLPQARVEYHLQEMVTNDYLHAHSQLRNFPLYTLAQKGRKYLVDNDLL